MAIPDEAANEEVTAWERAVARRWLRVFRVLVEKGDADALAVLSAISDERFWGRDAVPR